MTRLEQAGQITGYHADVADPDLVGLSAMIFVQIETRPCQPVLDWLRNQDGVRVVYSLSGEVDAIVHCHVGSAQELTGLNDRIGANADISGARSQLVLSRL